MQHISKANKLDAFCSVFFVPSRRMNIATKSGRTNHHLRGIWHGWFSFSNHFHSKSKFRGGWILFKYHPLAIGELFSVRFPGPVFIRLWGKSPILLISCYMVFVLFFTSDLGVQRVSNDLTNFEFRCKIMGLILNPAIWFQGYTPENSNV